MTSAIHRIVSANACIVESFFEQEKRRDEVQRAESWVHQKSHAMYYILFDLLHYSDFRPGCTWEERMLAKCVIDDLIRTFEPISRIDIRRAVWTFLVRPDNCDSLFGQFVAFTENSMFHGQYNSEWGFLNSDDLYLLGDSMWQVSCYVSRNLSPPPPYSLFDITSPAENFALTYQAMPMLRPQSPPRFENRRMTGLGTKRKNVISGSPETSRRQSKHARKRRTIKAPLIDDSLHPRISEVK